MGHQVNFWALPADIAELEMRLRELEPMLILHARSQTSTPRILPALSHTESGHPWLFYWLARACDLEHVRTKHVPAQGYWTVESLYSPVVEFSSCYFDGRILRRGRVHYSDGFYDEHGAWVEKPTSFRTWAESILRTTKKCLGRHSTDYIGRAASHWFEQGEGHLVT